MPQHCAPVPLNVGSVLEDNTDYTLEVTEEMLERQIAFSHQSDISAVPQEEEEETTIQTPTPNNETIDRK